ncbi:MAG: CopG family transcriptional regulator [bacterium]|nr:CopG family transcriptional regulator [bacterium]
MKTNITLKVDADLVREAKVLAAQRGTSVSGLLAQQLEDLVRRDRAYEAAKRRALARLGKGYDLQWTRPASRDDLHER